MLLQRQIGIVAQSQTVGSPATALLDVPDALIEEMHRVKVGVAELQELAAAGGGGHTGPLLAPNSGVEEIPGKDDVLMEKHLLRGEAHLGAARVRHTGGAAALVIQRGNLVDAHDHLVDLALIGVVGLAEDGGLHLTVGGLALHVVTGQVRLAEFVVIAAGLADGADGEDAGGHEIAGVGEVGHRHIGEIAVGPPALGDLSLKASGSASRIHTHCVLLLSLIRPHNRP